MFVKLRPLVLVGVSSRTTRISTTICSPAGMSMPMLVSSITRSVALPVFTGVQGSDPAILVTPTKRRSAAEALRSSRIFTS